MEEATTKNPVLGEPSAPSRRALWYYRAAVLFLLGGSAAGAAIARSVVADSTERLTKCRKRLALTMTSAQAAAGAPIGISHLDIQLAKHSTARRDWAEASYPLFKSPAGSVVLQLLAPGQRVPLHIHRGSDEVVAVVSGTATTRQIFGGPNRRATAIARHFSGTIIHSPPLTGHAFENASRDDLLALLVLAAPRDEGNWYVEPDDRRLVRGGRPFVWSPRDVSTDRTAPHFLRRLATTTGQFSVVVLAQGSQLPLAPKGPTLAYVLSGAGVLDDGRPHDVSARDLVFVRSPRGIRWTARPPGDLALLLFEAPAPPSLPPRPEIPP